MSDKLISTKIFERALEKWGLDAQLFLALEETSEFTAILAKHLNKRCEFSRVVGEAVDAHIMLIQVKLISDSLGYGNLWNNLVATKLKRLERMLDE